MNSTSTATPVTGQASKFKVLSIPLIGLTIGLAIGMGSYLLLALVLNNSEARVDSNRAQSEFSRSRTSEHIAGLDWIFTDNLDHSDLLTLSKSLKTLSQRELLDLIERSSHEPRTVRLDTIQEMLVECVAQYSPKEAIASIAQFAERRRYPLLQVIFSHWSATNLDEALVALSDLPQSDRHIAANAIFVEISDTSSLDIYINASNLKVKSELVAIRQELETYEMLDQDPSGAFSLLINDEIDDQEQIDLYRQIAEKWYQTDGLSIVPLIDAAPLGGGVFGELFKQITQFDREAALIFFSSVEVSSQRGLGYPLVEDWVVEDPESALNAVKSLPKSFFRHSMLRSVASDWARKSPNVVLERLLEIPRLYRADALSVAAAKFAQEDPKAALERIEELRSVPGTDVDRAVESVVKTWSTDAPKRALDWVVTFVKEGSKERADLLREVLPKYALVEPQRAMTIANEESKSRYFGGRLESYVIRSLLSADRFDTAIELVESARDEIKLSEYTYIGVELIEHNRMEDTLALADSIAENDRLDYFYRVASLALISERSSSVLDMIASLPTAEFRSDVAKKLLNERGVDGNFTEKQLETLRSFVAE
ncbi:MAG: hypothetical protein F4W92_06260 [Gammaproteobacteria bacterium]|nr:hypothetical protein [Gammaproteobacteria bacterium]